MDIETVNNNLKLMQELLTCGTNIYLWQYSFDGHLLSTNSSHLVLDKIFTTSGNKEQMIKHAQIRHNPFILGNELGMMWCAVYRSTGNNNGTVYVLGPVFNTEISSKTIDESVRKHNLDLSWRNDYINLLTSLPVISSILFFQYALMLHYCVTGEKLVRSDIQYDAGKSGTVENTNRAHGNMSRGDRMQTWLAERALLSMVREGDMNYQKAMDNASFLSNGVRSGEKDPLLHILVSCTSFTSLCVREAIEAGISPETAYTVGDSYIQNMVAAKNSSELASINHAMYEDFIMRVHRHRTNPKVSNYIQLCRDYIEMHVEDELSLSILAKYVGYSEYHLSRKFKQEMGVSISAYIKYARVERAKFLLTNTKLSISQIASDLHFCSGSHFSNAFMDVTGKKPQEYRREQPGI